MGWVSYTEDIVDRLTTDLHKISDNIATTPESVAHQRTLFHR